MNNPNAAIRSELLIKDIRTAEEAYAINDFQTVVKINKSLRRFGIQLLFEGNSAESLVVPLNDHWRKELGITD